MSVASVPRDTASAVRSAGGSAAGYARVTAASARRHSAMIRLVRLALAVAMLGLAGHVAQSIVTAALAPETAAPPQIVTDEDVRMVNPRFTGRDAAGAPYELTAQAAVRSAESAATTALENPRLVYLDADGASDEDGSIVTATTGVYDRGAGVLDLFGDVEFNTEGGYRFTTTHARVFVEDGRVVGEEPVEGQGPIGAVQAQSFEIFDSGERIVFRNAVEARIDQPRRTPAALRTDDEDPEEAFR